MRVSVALPPQAVKKWQTLQHHLSLARYSRVALSSTSDWVEKASVKGDGYDRNEDIKILVNDKNESCFPE